ncbi:lectin-like domain-containing protein [Companilactobacillus sp. HBUAS59699]|uniref:lectin-like domain-containing protein n=1 Tax=Companilactobacillus sp. HBUAS59699 TaxID=3109358 RepID=UPI002FF306E5
MRIRGLQIYLGVFFALLIGLFSLPLKTDQVEAAAIVSPADVLKAAPEGLDLHDYFEKPDTYSGSSIKDSATLVNKGDKTPTDLYEMTTGTDQLGSIWGKMTDSGNADYNSFDVTKDQTFSMWMYFSGTEGASSDGMAFVIQNDDKGINAISTYNQNQFFNSVRTPKTGESIGVWGGNGSGSSNMIINTTDLAAGAIQKSIAVEFDSYMNTTIPDLSSGKDDDFDAAVDSSNSRQVRGPHIAWNYPADSDTYKYNNTGFYAYYQMNHNNPIPDTYLAIDDMVKGVPKDSWHHVTIKYTAPESGSTTAHLQYIFDDKDTDGSVKKYREWDQRGDGADNMTHKIIDIDISKLNLTKGQTKVRWGITSSSETPTINAVIFQSLPALANVSVPTNLYDKTQERNILDANRYPSQDYNVNNGDQLRFDYNLNYDSGMMGTGDITTKINLPKHVDFTADSDGNIGEVVDSNGTQKIKATDLNSDGTISLTLKSLDSSNPNVEIHLNGKADIGDNTTASSTDVDPAHISYEGSHYTGDAMTPEFTINPVTDTLKIANTDDLNKTVKLGNSASMNGTISYDKGSKFGSDSVTVHTKVDGVQQDDATLSVDSTATTADYALKYDADTLGVGTHTVEVYVSDSKHVVSNHITYNVTVEDKKLILTSDNETSYTISPEDTILFTGSISYDDGTDLDSSNTYISYIVNGKTVLQGKPMFNGSDHSVYNYSYKLSASILNSGKNTLTITVVDGDGRTSHVDITINVTTKVLTLESNKSYRFQTTNQSNEEKLIRRSGDWDLKVTSAKTPWSLTAQSTALMNSTTHLPIMGTMIYRNGLNQSSLQDNPVLIYSDDNVSNDTVVTDVTKNWTDDTGILLSVQPDASAGSYTGEINWTLTDSIDTTN